MWGCFLMSGVKILHFLKDWWKSIPIHQNYTMALSKFNIVLKRKIQQNQKLFEGGTKRGYPINFNNTVDSRYSATNDKVGEAHFHIAWWEKVDISLPSILHNYDLCRPGYHCVSDSICALKVCALVCTIMR